MLGALAAVAEGPVAITLSRGGAPKRYDHTEPNEDATLFAHGSQGTLVAVADGHHGATGAQAVIAWLETECAARWTGPDVATVDETAWRAEAARALAGANHEVLADSARRGLPPAPTTLAFGVARPREGRLLWAGIGDSHLFAVAAEETTDLLRATLSDRRAAFLGWESLDADGLSERSAWGVCPLDPLRALVLATDGLSEAGIGVADPAGAVHEATRACLDVEPDLRPLALARRVGTIALEAQRAQRAGDNIASAAIWLAD